LRRSADCSAGTHAYRHATGPNSPDTHLRFALPVNTVPVVAHGGEAQPTASGGSAPDRVTGPVQVRDRSLCSDPPIKPLVGLGRSPLHVDWFRYGPRQPD
jgi:hypothetical protein